MDDRRVDGPAVCRRLPTEARGANAIKLAAVIDDADVRHLAWLQDRLGHDRVEAVIATTWREAYRRRDGIAVVPAALLGA
jgi:hypothetical protein